MKIYILFFIVVASSYLQAQDWVSMQYQIDTRKDILYGIEGDFAGKVDSLLLDISFPVDDVPPGCGRPLLVVVHGGAWMGGDKDEGYPARLREDFARRGYVAASVNYRLGMFHTDRFVNCNVPDWNCFNMTDTSEWYRANYRAMQDVKGAIRYLISQKQEYQVDANNVLLVGESAGAFVAMAIGYLEEGEESNIAGSLNDVPAPNNLYENNCIIAPGLANSIDEMDLTRPSLGSVDGSLHLAFRDSFRIRAVGSFYGGVFQNFFQTTLEPPALYLYHQPCDLIVPYRKAKLLAGYNSCFLGFPANCGSIINRPEVWGGATIADSLRAMQQRGENVPDFIFENTNNNYNCLQQAANPAQACHNIDNYPQRAASMATFFSNYIGSCLVAARELNNMNGVRLFPNPAGDFVRIINLGNPSNVAIQIYDSRGIFIRSHNFSALTETHVSLASMQKGLYFFKIIDEDNPHRYELVSLLVN
jgi:predicted esterase